MPQLGETVVEGTITKWLKKEGETVERDEPLFEISTDKVDTEVPSPLGGKLVEIKVQEGETVQVGTELAMIDSGGDGQAADGQAAEAPPKEEERGGGLGRPGPGSGGAGSRGRGIPEGGGSPAGGAAGDFGCRRVPAGRGSALTGSGGGAPRAGG